MGRRVDIGRGIDHQIPVWENPSRHAEFGNLAVFLKHPVPFASHNVCVRGYRFKNRIGGQPVQKRSVGGINLQIGDFHPAGRILPAKCETTVAVSRRYGQILPPVRGGFVGREGVSLRILEEKRGLLPRDDIDSTRTLPVIRNGPWFAQAEGTYIPP